jgi:hypothetical protein
MYVGHVSTKPFVSTARRLNGCGMLHLDSLSQNDCDGQYGGQITHLEWKIHMGALAFGSEGSKPGQKSVETQQQQYLLRKRLLDPLLHHTSQVPRSPKRHHQPEVDMMRPEG